MMLMRMRRFLRMLLLRLAAWLEDSSAAPMPPQLPVPPGPPAHWLEKVRKAQFVSSDAAASSPPAAAPVREVPRVGVPRVVQPTATQPSAAVPAADVWASRPHPGGEDTSTALSAGAARPAGGDTSTALSAGAGAPPPVLMIPNNVHRGAEPPSAAVARRSAVVPAAAPLAFSRPAVRSAAEVAAIRSANRPAEVVEEPPSMGPWPELPAGSRRSGRLEGGAPLVGASRRPISPVSPIGPVSPEGPIGQIGPIGRMGPTAPDIDTVNLLWPELPQDQDTILTLDDADHLRRIEAEQRGTAWSE